MYYRINNKKVYDYSDKQYFSDCQYTDIISALEYQEHPNKVRVKEEEHEVEIIDYDEEGKPIGSHTEVYYTYELEPNPDYEQEEAEKEKERIKNLNLTKADFWIALLDRNITKNMVKNKIQLMSDEKLKEKTLIRLDDADHFWRGDPSMNVIGAMFGLTSTDLDYLFIHKELPKGE